MDVIPAKPVRRRWSTEAKARIIALSFEPGANIAEIARTHGLLPQQLYAWGHDSIPSKRLASKKELYRMADAMNLPLGAVLEQALAALDRQRRQ